MISCLFGDLPERRFVKGMKSKEKKPMSLKRKILSVILKTVIALAGLIIIAAAVFAIMFPDAFMVVVKNPELIPYVFENWDSLSKGLNSSTEDIEAEQKASTDAQVQAFTDANINLTENDIANLSDENLTEEERVQIIYQAMTNGSGIPGTEGEQILDSPSSENSTEAPNVSEGKEDVSSDDVPGSDSVSVNENKPAQNTDAKPDSKPTSDNNTAENKPSADTKPSSDSKPAVNNKPANETKPSSPSSTAPQGNNSKPSSAPTVNTGTVNSYAGMTEDEYNMSVSELVAKVYSVKADFNSKLSAFESKVIADYKALPPEQRTSATKARIVSENMSYVMGLEAQCDAQVKTITDELYAIMTANGKPTTLVDQINAAYISEKENKKAYYISLYK